MSDRITIRESIDITGHFLHTKATSEFSSPNRGPRVHTPAKISHPTILIVSNEISDGRYRSIYSL